MDDILVYGKTFDEQLENLEAVLMKLRSKGIKLNVSECNFFIQKVKYLGRIISKDGYQADPDHAVALENFCLLWQLENHQKLLENFVHCWVSSGIIEVM